MSSGPLAPQDVATLQEIITQTAVACISYGILLVLACMTIRIQIWKREGVPRPVGQRWLLTAVLLTTICTTIFLSALIAFNINAMTQFGITPVSNESLARVTTVQVVCYRITFLISDTIVVWRAWVLSHGYTTRISLAFCLFATSGCITAEMVLTIKSAFSDTSGTKNSLLALILFVPMIVTNLLATCIVAYAVWNYRQHVSAYFDDGLKPGRTNVERVLTLLVESGSLYLVYWVFQIIVNFGFDTYFPDMVVIVFTAFLPYLSAIYPIGIILLVQRDKISRNSIILEHTHTTSGPIRFASSNPHRSGQTHSHSIIQSIADQMRSTCPDEEIGTVRIEEHGVASSEKGSKRT